MSPESSFWSELTIWDWGNIVGVFLVLVGVVWEVILELIKAPPNPYATYSPNDPNAMLPTELFFGRNAWEFKEQIRAKRKHFWEIVSSGILVFGLLLEMVVIAPSLRHTWNQNEIFRKDNRSLAKDNGLIRYELGEYKRELNKVSARHGIFQGMEVAAKRLSAFKGIKAEISYDNDDDAKHVSWALFKVLKSAGWSVMGPYPDLQPPIQRPSRTPLLPDEGVIVELRPRQHPSMSAYGGEGPLWQQIMNREAAARAVTAEINAGTIKAQQRDPATEGEYIPFDVIFIRVALEP